MHLLQRRKIQNRREHLATRGYVTLSAIAIYLARTTRFLHLSLGHDHHLVPRSSYNTIAVNGDNQRFLHLSLSHHPSIYSAGRNSRFVILLLPRVDATRCSGDRPPAVAETTKNVCNNRTTFFVCENCN
jgi:hypothetical protein